MFSLSGENPSQMSISKIMRKGDVGKGALGSGLSRVPGAQTLCCLCVGPT